MQRMTPNSENLPLMNKVEVFEHSLENTFGDDLAKILLLKAPSSEVWFDRRTNFTRSLAVMSMVGYVLGLGDRHAALVMVLDIFHTTFLNQFGLFNQNLDMAKTHRAGIPPTCCSTA